MSKIKTKFAARWANAGEARRVGQHNGVLEDVTSPKAPKHICFISPMSLALRVAALLNFGERFHDDEIEQLGKLGD